MADEIAFGGRPMTKEEEDEWKLQQQQQPELQPPPKRPEVTNPVERIATDNVQNFIEENIYVPLVDTVDNLLGDKRSTEQIRSDRKDLNTKVAEKRAAREIALEEAAYSNPLTTIATETLRAGLGGIEGFAEGVGETGEYIGDILGSPVAALRGDWKNVPWSDSYESSDWEFGIVKENKTWQGNLGRNMISMVLQMRQLARLKVGIGGGQSGISRLGSEALRGGIVDFFNDPGEANLSNLLETGITNEDGSLMKYWDFLPGVGGKDLLRHPNLLFTQALKHEDEDNDLIRRLKNSVEGGVFGIAVDGLMETYGAWRHGLRKGIEYQARTGKPGGDVFINEAADYLWHGTSGSAASNIDKGGFRYSRGMNALVGEGVYFTDSQGYASLYGAESGKQGVLIGGTLPTDAKILDTTGLVRGINPDEGISFLDWLDTHLNIKASDIDSQFIEELGETFYYLSREQKAQLKDWVTSQGYAGIRFDPDFANKEFGEGGTLETAIYDLDVANRLVGSRAGSINIEDTPGMLEARRRVRANPRNAEEIIEADWQGALDRLGIKDYGDKGVIDQMSFEDRAALRIDTQLKVTGRDDGYPQAVKITKLLNGEEIHWAFHSTAGGKALDVSWSATGKISEGAGARRVFRDFPRIISELPPGTVLVNSPTADLISEASGAQQRRMARALWPGEKFISEEESLNLAADIWEQRHGTPPDDYDAFLGFRRLLEDRGEIPYTLESRIYKEEGDIDPDTYTTDTTNLQDNTRARLYKQVGFSDPDDGGMQFGIVRATLNQNDQLLDPLPNGLRAFDLEQRLDAARNSEVPDPTKRPGYSERKFQQDTQPPRGEDGATDPTERIGRTTEYSLNEAAISQETKVFDQTLVGGSNPSVNDATVSKLKEMSQPELIEYIKVRSPQISIDEIARSVSKQPEQYVQEALLGLARFATDGKVDHIADLGNYWREVHRFDQEGIAILRVLSNDVSEQMYDLAEYMLQLDGIDEPLRKASIQYLERAKVLMKLKKEASSDSGFGLLNWWVKKIPPDMHASIKKANAEIDAAFDNYLKVFENGDTVGMLEIRDDFLEFARGTVASQGDPTQIVSFFSSMMRVGIRNANQAVINAWLSSPVSQVRNLAGNAIVAAERPFATVAGHAFVGEWKEARAAFSMLDSIHISGLEALRIARKSLGSDIPITEGNKLAEFTEFSSQTRRDIDNLHRVASNPAQKFVANLFDWHYTLINLPWNTWPGRGLQSGDDFFKALTAQMDLRYEAALAADGHMFKNRTQANAEYKRLLLEKIGPNGEILDPTLKYNAQEATFQLDLEGKMARVANSLNAHPEMKQFIPFIRTPHNINVFASQHIPLPYGEKLIPGFGREYDEIMKNGTAQQKALLRGRKAVGGLLVTYGFAMAANGMLTGNGPSDPELRELWRRYNEPMSIKVGEDEDGNPIWQSYRSIPGADLIFSLIADTQFLAQYLPEAEGGKLLGQLMYTISQSITNRSTLAGFIELAGFLDGENWTLRGIGRSSGDWANDLLPIFGGSGLRRQFENAQADGIYEYRNTLEAIKGRVTAGIIGDKVPVMDILTGKQMLRGTEGWGNFLNPFRTVHKDAHPVARRLGDLRYELNRGNVEYVKDGRVREPLTIEEQQFIREHTYNNGKLVKDLENYLNSDKFKNYYQQWEEAKGTVDQKTRQNSEWYRKISEIIHFHRRQATKKLRSDNTDPVALEFQTRVRLANDDADRQRTLERATPR